MISTKKIVLEVTAPEFIGNVIKDAIVLANNHGCPAEFYFRAVIVIVEPGETEHAVYGRYSWAYDKAAASKPQTYEQKHKENV